jgi:hypothetical protein
MVQDYSENRVDTLHMKNLLHLGEDRYLTTLLLKHFPTFKTQFIRDAHAYTVAPDDWKVLLSQRRRWINSTVHNLGELVFLEQLCGFCCFSMRFVVMIDLLSTITQPVTVAYVRALFFSGNMFVDFLVFVDRIPYIPRGWAREGSTDYFYYHDCCHLWCSSTRVRVETEMGYGWMDAFLYPCYSGVFVLPSALFVLEDGRFLLGSDSYCVGRIWEEGRCSCEFCLFFEGDCGLD